MSRRTVAQPKRGNLTSAPSGILQRACACGTHTVAGGDCEACKKKQGAGMLQRAAIGEGPGAGVPPVVGEVLRASGEPLDASTRGYFEPRFGHDFSQVRVHTDGRAAASAEAVNALAYTVGRDLVFGAGQYAPGTAAGRHLMAHELAHVVQQKRGTTAGGYSLLSGDSMAEREAEQAARDIGEARPPRLSQQVSPAQIGRTEKSGAGQAGGAANSAGANPTAAPAANPAGNAAPGQPQRLRFDILGADLELVNFLAKAAALSRNPDLRVTSLEDMITQLKAKAPPNSNRCIEYVGIFNHGRPGYQVVAGGGDKKVSTGGGTPSKLKKSYLSLDWLYDPANQTALAELRGVFCCNANMHWLGCGVAGVEAEGGKRSKKETEESKDRYVEEADRYRDEQDALAHGANLQGATFGKVTVQSWADATCTTIRSATDYVVYDNEGPSKIYHVGYGGQFLDIQPSAAGQCGCDASGHAQGTWTPGQGVDYGDSIWQTDLAAFKSAMKPASGSPNATAISQALLKLLADVAWTITVPAAIQPFAGPKVEPWINSTLADPGWVAYTYDYLALNYPNDFWKWIAVNPTIIQQTPSYTRTTLEHELQHAVDINLAAFEYQLINGPPPTPPPAAMKPNYQATAGDAYGQYVLNFRTYYQSGVSDSRHLDIYASSAAPNFKRFTPSEKLAWFSSMIRTVPPDVGATAPLSSEGLVAGVFQNPLASEATMRTQFANDLFLATSNFIYGTKEQPKDLGKAKTLLNHFDPVWTIHKTDRAMLFGVYKSEGGKP